MALPVYSYPDGQGLPGEPIGYRIAPDGEPQHANIGFVVVPKLLCTVWRLDHALQAASLVKRGHWPNVRSWGEPDTPGWWE